MRSDFRLLMLGAMYENGGNTTHRFLDGHPQLLVYPFESQLGTRLVNDQLSLDVPGEVPLAGRSRSTRRPAQDYRAIIDEEGKVRARTPHVSKFRDYAVRLRRRRAARASTRSYVRADAAARAATTWRRSSARRSTPGRTTDRTRPRAVYVGYSPIIVVDADKILDDLPERALPARRAQPVVGLRGHEEAPGAAAARDYMLGWTLNQYYALLFQRAYPDRMHIVRTEDVMADPVGDARRRSARRLGLEPARTRWRRRAGTASARARSIRGARSARRRPRRTWRPPASCPPTSRMRSAT